MTEPDLKASVVIVSRHRSAALQRCIAALRQQDHNQFELIVVADPAAISDLAAQHDIKTILYDHANISTARNLGLMAAASGIVAFIDDDAVAEPSWLSRLTAPFVDPKVIAATGFVRGRNGISFQWRACEVDHLGLDHSLDVTDTTLLPSTPKRAVKTQGTNCAFRTDILRSVGGFDLAFRFYLDEADVNLRMAPYGLTAIVPKAQVHHGYLQSAYRRQDRVPITLFEIGASVAVFLRRHAERPDITQIAQEQGRRLDALTLAGKITSYQSAQLMATLHQGWAEGLERPLRAAEVLPNDPPKFLPLGGTGPRRGIVLAGRMWSRKALTKKARMAVEKGQIVTIICLSPTLKDHWVEFTNEGFWLQTGGIWGRADRDGPRLVWGHFQSRLRREIARICSFRPVS